jgi:hypothetical protein
MANEWQEDVSFQNSPTRGRGQDSAGVAQGEQGVGP